MKILLAITFVYGVLRLLTYTKLFKTNLTGIIESVLPYDEDNNNLNNFFHTLSTWFFYFSLVYQSWYWIFS